MNSLDQQRKSLDQCDAPLTEAELSALQSTLETLQGNILRSHGRNYSVYIFLRFDTEKRDQTKAWIAKIAPRITHAQKQRDEAQRYDGTQESSGDVFWGFFLSAHGYEQLGIPQYRPADLAFRDGMAKRRIPQYTKSPHSVETPPLHNDPPQGEWDQGYQGPEPIDAMLLLADDDQSKLPWEEELSFEKQVPKLADHLQNNYRNYTEVRITDVATVCAIEYGRVMRKKTNTQENFKRLGYRDGQSFEHFGYADGRSQPLFFQKDVDKEEEKRGGTDRWNPAAGPSLVLVKELNSDSYSEHPVYGSYLVFRKLHQDVTGFKSYLTRLATKLELKGLDRPRAEALVMGRFRDGTPVVLQSIRGQYEYEPVPNNFDFGNDPQGMRCPFQAHIRKMNPRGERDRSIRGAVAAARRDLATAGRKLKGVTNETELKCLLGGVTSRLSKLTTQLQRLSLTKQDTSILSDLTTQLQRLSLTEPAQLGLNISALFTSMAATYDEPGYRSILSDLTTQLQRLLLTEPKQPILELTPSGLDVNPDQRDYRNERDYRIARRSVPYGKKGDAEVGLLFMCYQSDISQQFEFLQATWASNEEFPVEGTGPDAIIGPASKTPHKWPRQWNTRQPRPGSNRRPLRWDEEPPKKSASQQLYAPEARRAGYVSLNFEKCITLKGGEYLFAPSLPFLMNITEIGALSVSD